MAKRYYWLKLPEDFFEDDTIRYIENNCGPNGILYSNFYLKLCLKSLRSNGKLVRLVGEYFIPYDYPALSSLTGVPIDTVKTAMEIFIKFGIVKETDGGGLYMAQIKEMIGSETEQAKQMRELRAQRRDSIPETDNNNVVTMLPQSSEMLPDIEKELETELETESDLETEKDTEVETEEEKNISSASKKALETRKARELFEHLWSLYPKKRGKSNVSDTKKKQLLAVGRENMEVAIANYIDEIERNHTDMQYVKHGSSFFNGAYVDYLPENFSPLPVSRPARGSRGESVEDYMRRTEGWERYADDYAGIQPDQGDHQE